MADKVPEEQLNRIYAAMEAGEYETAIRRSEAFLAAGGDPLLGWELLASAYIETKQAEKAAMAAQQLALLAPEDAYARFLRVRVRFMQGERISLIAELEDIRQRGRHLQPACREKVCNLLGQCCRFAGDSRRSAEYYQEAAKYADSRELRLAEYSNYLFNLHYRPDVAAADYVAAHKHYNALLGKVTPFLHRKRAAGQKLRIGYISPDFRQHVVLRFALALFTYFNREQFTIWGYANCPDDGETRQLKAEADGWRNIYGLHPAEAARQIYEDQMDILVDLSGHTAGSCLPILAYKPAPVQLCGIGYFATTGLAAVDYFIGDRFLDGTAVGGVKASPDFTEKLLVLPHSHLCYTPRADAPAPGEAPCRRNGYVTFGSFNNCTKITDEVLAVWQAVLQRVPGSRLLLKGSLFDDAEGRTLMGRRLRQQGIDSGCVELRGFGVEYLGEYADVDIALDTFPYPGGGTTCDALYMGVPVISLSGASHGARFGCSLLQNAGLPELCASSTEEYIEKAVLLAGQPELLAGLHQSLRTLLAASPVMDGAAYLRDLEAAYKTIWQRYQARPQGAAAAALPGFLTRLRALAAEGDRMQVLAAVEQLLAARVRQRALLEELAGLCIDAQDAATATACTQQLLRCCGPYGYACFLAARAAYLRGDWAEVESLSQQALADRQLPRWQQGMVQDILGRTAKASGNAKEAAQRHLAACRLLEDAPGRREEYSNYLFDLHFFAGDAAWRCQEARRYNELLADIPPAEPSALPVHERLRVGYVSADFGRHVMGYFCQALLRDYDRACFEVYVYANCSEDARTRELRAMPEHWRSVLGQPVGAIVQQIKVDEIDILVDLSGHTKGNLLPVFACRPAPVQISGLGYMSTTGLAAMDYFLSDGWLSPAKRTDQPQLTVSPDFTEKLLVLPHSHLCYVPPQAADLPAAPCRVNGYMTFGCFNNFTKVTDEVLAVWSEILKAVPDSRLFLKAGIFSQPEGKKRVAARLLAAGIALERVMMEGYTEDYLAAYGRVDIALDTFPYAGGGTTCDALYMGVPVISLAGSSHNTRFGFSLLANLGLQGCCAASEEEYVSLAVRLAGQPKRVVQLHQTLRRRLRSSYVMDAGLYMADLEAAYALAYRMKTAAAQTAGGDLASLMQQRQWAAVARQALRLRAQGQLAAAGYTAAGFAYMQLEEYSRAEAWLRQAAGRDTANDAEIAQLLGKVLYARCHYVASYACYAAARRRLEQGKAPVSPGFYRNLLLDSAHGAFLLGQGEKSAAGYLAASARAQSLADRCSDYSSYLLSLHLTDCPAAGLREAHAGYGALLREVKPLALPQRLPHKKLRIGYLSPDFRQHVMFAFLYVLLAAHDKDRFAVYGYQLNTAADGFTEALRPLADVWREAAGMDYAQLAQQIAGDEIDILVDLAGHSSGSGLPVFAWRAAPVQISGLGYMATTGLLSTDYYLTDAWVVPAGGEAAFTEKLLRLPSQFCYAARSDVPAPGGAPCCQHGYVQFGVFNHFYKVSDAMLRAWQEILARVPGSRLLFKSQELISDSVVTMAAARLRAAGFDLDRVAFEPATSDYMERYLAVDIALDTFPWPGGGTTCDALYMGVPVVSLYGGRAGSRFGLSILQQAGIGELAAADLTSYIERAVALAKDPQLLDTLHQRLRSMLQASPLMDAKGYMQALETAYENIAASAEGKKEHGEV